MALFRTRQAGRAGIAGLVLVALTVSGCANAEPSVVAYVDEARITQRQVDDAVDAISGTLEEGQRVSSQAVVNDIADEQIVASRLGQQYLTEIGKINVTLNPRLGVLDPQQKTIIENQSSSLASSAPAGSTP